MPEWQTVHDGNVGMPHAERCPGEKLLLFGFDQIRADRLGANRNRNVVAFDKLLDESPVYER